MAIARYVSHKAKLQGDNDHDFAMSEMLLEEQNDIYNALAKAQYARANKSEAWKNALEVEVPKHLDHLEKLLPHGQHHFGSKLTAGDVSIFSIINIVHDVDAHVLDKYPKLKGLYDHIAALPAVAAYIHSDVSSYFKKE